MLYYRKSHLHLPTGSTATQEDMFLNFINHHHQLLLLSLHHSPPIFLVRFRHQQQVVTMNHLFYEQVSHHLFTRMITTRYQHRCHLPPHLFLQHFKVLFKALWCPMRGAEGVAITNLIQVIVIWILIWPNCVHLSALHHHLYKDLRHLQILGNHLVDSKGPLMQHLQQKQRHFYVPFVAIMLHVNITEWEHVKVVRDFSKEQCKRMPNMFV